MSKPDKKGLFSKMQNFLKENGIAAKVVEETDKKEDNETKDKFTAFLTEKFGKERAEKFVDVTLADGTMAVAEPALEVGAAMVVMSEDGEPVPAPIGSYELEDGTIVVVEEEGVISEIQAAGGEGENNEPAAEEDMNNEEQKVKRVVESVIREKQFKDELKEELLKDEKFKALEEVEELKKVNKFLQGEAEEMTVKYNEVVTKFNALQEFMKDFAEELLAEPSKEPKVKNKNPLAKEPKESIFSKPYKK